MNNQTTEPAPYKKRDESWAEYVERMVAAERERCAKFVEDECIYGRVQAAVIARKIRNG